MALGLSGKGCGLLPRRPSLSKPLNALGLMSGTSLDGIDVALLRTDGEDVVERGPAATYPYRPDQQALLQDAIAAAKALEPRRAARHSGRGRTARSPTGMRRPSERFLRENGLSLSDIDVIGFHGQTVIHRPERRLTVQLGVGAAAGGAAGPSRSSTTCAPPTWRRRAGRAAGAGLSPGAGGRAEGAPGRLRQHRRRRQHDLDRDGRGTDRLRHRSRQCAAQRLVRASHGCAPRPGRRPGGLGNVATHALGQLLKNNFFATASTQVPRPQRLRCIRCWMASRRRTARQPSPASPRPAIAAQRRPGAGSAEALHHLRRRAAQSHAHA